jgi:hypothetical protein
VIELPDGEAFKTLETLQMIFDGLVRPRPTAERSCSRSAVA